MNSLIPKLNLPFQIGRVGILCGSLFLGQWFLSDVVHLPGGGIGLAATCFGVWWLSKPSKTSFESPSTVDGWVRRCEEVLDQFEALEDGQKNLRSREERFESLQVVLDRAEPQSISFVSSKGVEIPDKIEIESAIDSNKPIDISWFNSLPLKDKTWLLPKQIYEKDLLVYILPVPLRAVDMLWLEKIPEDQQSWILIPWLEENSWNDQLIALNAQLPSRWTNRLLRWSGDLENMHLVLNPVRQVLDNPKRNIERTRQRLLSRLHVSWQSDLEKLRRQKFSDIQLRNQWIVAGAVFASPVPSTDLLSIAVVNGLMVQEMAKIWSCPWQVETLKVVARQLASIALAQGVVEWSGQALLGVSKLHGSSWLAAGTLQALSAAYLTRVVGRSMADWMALNNGVMEPDLKALKLQATHLVTNAAEKERLDWAGFLKQASFWINESAEKRSIKISTSNA